MPSSTVPTPADAIYRYVANRYHPAWEDAGMTQFPVLREPLHAWVSDAVAALAADGDAAYEGLGEPQWRRDADGIFRNMARPYDEWDFRKRRQLGQLATWPAAEHAFHADERLSHQIGTMVRTAHGGLRLEALGLAMHLLPRPSQLDQTEEIFERGYSELEAYLAADELGFKAFWPVPGLVAADLPVELEPGVVLDAMSDRELVLALRAETVRPSFFGQTLFEAEPASRTCVRYRYRLPKLTGPRDDNADRQFQELNQRLLDIRAAIEEALTLACPEPVMAAGQLGSSDQLWSPLSGGISCQPFMLPHHARWRRVEVDAGRTSALRQAWNQVARRDLLGRHKGLALALRRLSYQAQRERPEDELLDIMIAAEALYLTQLGPGKDRGELRYRLALRAAVWTDDERLGMTKREVLKLMQSAYDARSAIAHGGNPESRDMKIKGERVELPELVRVTRAVVTAGCSRALNAADASGTGWPPDWDALILAGPQAS